VKAPLSVVVPARDEADRIADFVAANDWADEVLVADNGSVDDTAERARAAGATVIDARGHTIAGARNAGAAAARHDWILALDTDERVSVLLREELARLLTVASATAYEVRRRNLYLGREQRRGRWGRDWIVRLYRREHRFIDTAVHEKLEPVAETGTLAGEIDHDPYRDLSHHIAKMDRYARWGAEQMWREGKRASAFDLVFRPLWRFVKAYLLGLSILDGKFGLVTSMLGAQTAFMKYAHLWALEAERQKGGTAGDTTA
jgi:glycosyltransferase involved in cell wall biosynthesis